MFAHSLRKFSMRDWGIEQKWMSILLPLLLLYNGENYSTCQFSFSLFKYDHSMFKRLCLAILIQYVSPFFLSLFLSLSPILLLLYLLFALFCWGQIPSSHYHSWWTAGSPGPWMPFSRPCSSVPCCSSGSVFITEYESRWVFNPRSTSSSNPFSALSDDLCPKSWPNSRLVMDYYHGWHIKCFAGFCHLESEEYVWLSQKC